MGLGVKACRNLHATLFLLAVARSAIVADNDQGFDPEVSGVTTPSVGVPNYSATPNDVALIAEASPARFVMRLRSAERNTPRNITSCRPLVFFKS